MLAARFGHGGKPSNLSDQNSRSNRREQNHLSTKGNFSTKGNLSIPSESRILSNHSHRSNQSNQCESRILSNRSDQSNRRNQRHALQRSKRFSDAATPSRSAELVRDRPRASQRKRFPSATAEDCLRGSPACGNRTYRLATQAAHTTQSSGLCIAGLRGPRGVISIGDNRVARCIPTDRPKGG